MYFKNWNEQKIIMAGCRGVFGCGISYNIENCLMLNGKSLIIIVVSLPLNFQVCYTDSFTKKMFYFFLWLIQVKLSNVFWLAKGLLYWQEGRYCFQGFLTPALKSYDICYLNKAVDSWFNFLFGLKYISFIPWKWNPNNGYSSQWNFLPHMCGGSSCTIVKG